MSVRFAEMSKSDRHGARLAEGSDHNPSIIRACPMRKSAWREAIYTEGLTEYVSVIGAVWRSGIGEEIFL
jgi:hypothetical protein